MSKDETPARTPSKASARNRTGGARKELVERQIFDTAIGLFAERGFAGTSLQNIADSLGVTRPALYYYFSSKDDLLERLVREATIDAADRIESITASGDLDPSATLRELVRVTTAFQLAHRDHFKLLVRSEAELPPDLAEVYASGRRRVLRVFISCIEAGIAAGQFRPADPRTSALGIIGMVNWVAWWHHPDVDETGIAEQFAELALGAVRVQTAAHAASTPREIFSILREDIELLDRLLPPEAPHSHDGSV